MRIKSTFISSFGFTIILILIFGFTYGQSFSPVETDPVFKEAHFSAARWVDIDNDGDLDVFYLGSDNDNIPRSQMYRNDGGDNFTEFFPAIAGLSYACCDFADIDNDGDPDLAVAGFDGTNNVSRIYRNDGGFTFSDINAGLEGLANGSLQWGDYDHDAYPDLLLSGLNNDGFPVTYLYRNLEGTGFTDSTSGLAGLAYSSLAWSDFDNDGDLDFGMCGKDSLDLARTLIYTNTNGFFEPLDVSLDGLWGGMLSWGDYNNDGYADLLINGTDLNDQSRTLVYKNISGQAFNLLPASFAGISGGSALWGDMNNNGSLDIVVAGTVLVGGTPPPPPDDPIMYVYKNTGGDLFEQMLVDNLDIPVFNDIALGDYDNDSDLDMLVSGSFYTAIGESEGVKIFRNDVSLTNIPPAAPTNLSIQISGRDLIFQWDESVANTSPQGGLNYNLRIGTQAGNMNILSALADISSGYRRVVAHGNAGPNDEITLYDIPFGELYYASVQAIDHAYAGSAFSEDISFAFLPTALFTLDDSVCINAYAEVIYTGNASPDAIYNWDSDGGSWFEPPIGPGPHFVAWDETGLKTVSLTVTEDGVTSQLVEHEILVVNPVTEKGNISGQEDICQGTEATIYTTTFIPGAVSYKWDVEPPEAGDFNGNGLQAELIWNPDYHGTATITVQGVNVCGTGPVSDPKIVTVKALPEKPDTPQGPTNLCQVPSITQYSTNAAAFADEYIWQLFPEDAGELSGDGTSTVEISWDENFIGLAKLVVIGENACGQGPASDTLEIEIKLSPTAYAGEDQQIVYLTSTTLDGSASGGSGSYSFYWTPEELLIDHTVEDPKTIALELSTVFTLTVTDEGTFCEDEDDVIIQVSGGPLSVTASAEPDTICPGDSSKLLALAGGPPGFTINWSSSPPGFSDSIPDPVVFPLETTTYYVEVSDGVDFVTDSVQVVVSLLPDPPGAINGPMEVCAGDEDILYSIEPVANASRYIWSLADGMFGSSDSTSILVSFADPFINAEDSIIVRAANECGFENDVFSYLLPEVNTLPETPLAILGQDSLCTTTDTTVVYEIQAAIPGADLYEWKIIPEEAGSITGDGLSVQMNWVKNWEGEASIIVRALNNCGASDWSESKDIVAYSCVGIHEISSAKISFLLYPNPARESISLEIKSEFSDPFLDVFITDLYGRVFEQLHFTGDDSHLIINTASWPSGMYLIRITGNDRVRAVAKFLISH